MPLSKLFSSSSSLRRKCLFAQWFATPSYWQGAVPRDPAPSSPITWTSKEPIAASSPSLQPGYSARARTLPNGVYSNAVSKRSVDPVDPAYHLPAASDTFLHVLHCDAAARQSMPGTVRPRWDDLSDIPGATRKAAYVRPTPYDAHRYDDVPKMAKTFRGGGAPRATAIAAVDVRKLPAVPFNRSVASNPLEPEYNYDKRTEETFDFNASVRLGLRGTMKATGGEFEVLGHIGSLRHAGLGGPRPENARKFTHDKGIKRLYTGNEPLRS